MAYAKVRVLICDACGTNQHTDDPAEAGLPLWRTAKARLLLAIGLVALAGWLLARRIVLPVEQLRDTARTIATSR